MPSKIAAQGSEEAEQTALFCWAAMNFEHCPELRLMFAIPNGGKRDPVTAAKLKAQGVRAGVPDVLLPVPRPGPGHWYAGLFIELKKLKGGNLRDANQIAWASGLIAQGYAHHLVRGGANAAGIIMAYMGSERPWIRWQ